jgi:cytochrome d ubiquinol oxidase subunit II
MALQATWFILITILWSGFFMLEGFDFGVGMLVPFLGHTDTERRMLRATTGPFWDGNEVWLVTAGAATFAAFPDWYATMFSAYYLPLFIVVVALILRAVGSEYRDKRGGSGWRTSWDWITVACCLSIPLLIGVAFGGLLNGIPIDQQMEFTGTFADLVQPYALATGILLALLCRLKVAGDLSQRASHAARTVAWIAVAVLVVHVIWTRFAVGSGVIPNLGAWMAMTAAVATAWLAGHDRHRGLAFGASATTIVLTLFGFFAELYPNLMVSSTATANNITTADSSGSYTLTLMTIVTVVMLPVVLIYTTWSYWVFRQRVTIDSVSADPTTTEA